jgi:hypothetical protein
VTRGAKWAVMATGALLGAVVGYLLGKRTAQSGLLALGGIVGGTFLASGILRLVTGVRAFSENQEGWMREVEGLSANPQGRLGSATLWRDGPQAVIEAIVAKDPTLQVLAPDQLASLPSVLHQGEGVAHLVAGTLGGRPGLLAVTDRRVLFLEQDGGRIELVFNEITRLEATGADLLGTIEIATPAGRFAFQVPGAAVDQICEYLRGRVPVHRPE